MRARIKGNSREGDDNFSNRLLSYLNTLLPGAVQKLEMIRPNVFYMRSVSGEYIIKGYSSNNKLKLQEAFTATLKKEGFTETYSFFRPGGKEPAYFEGLYLGFMEYLSPHPNQFSFVQHQDRSSGLVLLQEYHNATRSFEKRYRTVIKSAHLLEKWEDRRNQFSANAGILRTFMGDESIAEILSWADWALEGMEGEAGFFSEGPSVILHGDVAHHNFLRTRDGKLKLIDFDLISLGPPCLDLLQYANRILPFINWSAKRLEKYRPIAAMMDEKAFLSALAYPSDILREWNRLIRNGETGNERKLAQVKELTWDQFYLRQQFTKEIQSKVKWF